MDGKILTRVYPNPPINKREVLRYAGVWGDAAEISELVDEVIRESIEFISPAVCYTELSVVVGENFITVGNRRIDSAALARHLSGAEKAVIFAATVGARIDRLTAKYAVSSPTKALLLGALGAERIECAADNFCEELRCEAAARGFTLTQRFSPGYADLSLEVQRDIFAILDCPKRIGLSLGDSLLMSPTKSITAIVGLRK